MEALEIPQGRDPDNRKFLPYLRYAVKKIARADRLLLLERVPP